ncbi:MAG: SCO family protein [Halieaceae bacterium]|nr:SCO family protein [Halieaceae bacterium]
MSQRSNIRMTVFILLGIMMLFVGGFVLRVTLPQEMSATELKSNGLYLHDTPRSLGQFQLVNQKGEAFVPGSLQGRWSLLFFGFTYCPDVCPTTMAFLDNFVAGLDEDERLDTQVVMVSVDPARDTVEQLATYVPFFNPTFTGVTGEFLDIHRFATALNTPFRKVAGSGDDYQVDHSANVVLINPKGDYHGFFKAPLDREKMMKTYRAARAGWKH